MALHKDETKLYPCCDNPECRVVRHTQTVFKVWGLQAVPAEDAQGKYYRFVIPHFWSGERTQKFRATLADLRRLQESCRRRR